MRRVTGIADIADFAEILAGMVGVACGVAGGACQTSGIAGSIAGAVWLASDIADIAVRRVWGVHEVQGEMARARCYHGM